MNYENDDIIMNEPSSASAIIRALLIAAPFLFFLIYVNASGKKIRELEIRYSQEERPSSTETQRLQKENDALREQISEIQISRSATGSNALEIQNLNQTIARLNNDKKILNDQIKKLKGETDGATGHSQLVESKLEQYQILYQRNITQIQTLQTEIDQCRRELTGSVQPKDVQLKLEQCQNLNRTYEGQIRDLRSQLYNCQNQPKTNDDQSQQTKNQLTVCQSLNRSYSTRIVELQTKNNTLQTQLDQCNRKLRVTN